MLRHTVINQTRFRFRFIRDHTVSPHYEWAVHWAAPLSSNMLYHTSVNQSTVATSAQQQTEKLTACDARTG